MALSTVQEGFVPFKGYKTYYKIVGRAKAGKLPLLCLHGGPGVPHDYLLPFEDIVRTGRQVIFYDQLGCGQSDKPDTDTLFTIKTYVQEVDAVRQALGLKKLHVLGQSWGGMLTMEYLLTRPKGVACAVIESSPSDIPLWVEEANRLREDLPPDQNAILLRHEQAGTTDSPEYQAAMQVFYDRHVCRVVPNPDYVQHAIANTGRQYLVMNGPSEFHIVGTIKNWRVTNKLHQIKTPVLFMSGIYDECTPIVAKQVVDALPNCEWVLWQHSSHMCHVEERPAVMKTVASFIKRFD